MAGKTTLSDEEKARLGGEDAAKAAQKAKPGDTELSGAAPGIKAKTDDTVSPEQVETFDVPAKARRAQRRADKRADEVREIQRDVQSANLLENVPPENVRTVFATRQGDKDPDSLTIVHEGSTLTLLSSSSEMTFDREDALGVQRAFNAFAGSM